MSPSRATTSRRSSSAAVGPLSPFLEPLSVLDGAVLGHDVPLELAGGAVEHLAPANFGVEGDNEIEVEVRPHGPFVLFRHEILLEKFGGRAIRAAPRR
jgi:hypothetical protein